MILIYLLQKPKNSKINYPIIIKKNLMLIPFEQFVLNPYNFIEKINSLLETSSSKFTNKILRKQKVPRKKISDGIPLKIYKRFGWEPGDKNLNEKEELIKRREYIIKEGVTEKYLNSWAIKQKINRDAKHARQLKIDSTPMVVVDGKYIVEPKRSYDEMLQIVDYIIDTSNLLNL